MKIHYLKNYIFFFILFIFSIVGCKKEVSNEQNQIIITKETREQGFNKLIGQTPPKFEWNFALPIEINYFLNLIGKPDSIFIELQSRDTLGQLMQWNFLAENVKMSLFVENFSQSIDTNSFVRAVLFESLDNNKSAEIIALNGIKLNSDFENTRQQLTKYIQKNNEFNFNNNIKDSTFFQMLSPNSFKTLSIKNDRYFYYFSFNTNEKLKTIIFSSYDL